MARRPFLGGKMNRVFSIVRNQAPGAWLVAGEHATLRSKHGKSRRGRLVAGLAGLLVSTAALGQAWPVGGQVVAGSGAIGAAAGGKLVVDQTSQRMAIDWQQFNIGAGNTVRFNQPGAGAVALNRVLGPDASQIMGRLQA